MTIHRRYLTFSLRALFILVTASAVWLGIVVHRAHEQREAVKAIQALGGGVRYDWEYLGTGEPHGPAWLRQLIGDEFFQEVELVTFDSWPPGDRTDILRAIPYLRRLHRLNSVVVPASTSKKTLEQLKAALPNCDVWWPTV